MLRITQQSSPDAAKQYYTSADYYTEGQEIVGRWGGQGARMLGLEGPVSKRAFNALCENRNPRTGERLTPRTKDDRTVGYDFTWSVPKSVSLLYALTEDQEVLAAFRDSVHETMRDIEAEMKARVRKDGRNEERVTGNLAYGEFVHFTSRPVQGVPDPQLHAHCFVFNATFDAEEEQWKAGQFRDLKRDAPTGRPRSGCGWPTGCRRWATPSTASATISRSRALRRRRFGVSPGGRTRLRSCAGEGH